MLTSAVQDIERDKRFTVVDELGEHIIRASEIYYLESQQRSTGIRTGDRFSRCGLSIEEMKQELDVMKEYLVLKYVVGFQQKRKTGLLALTLAFVPVGIGALGNIISHQYLSLFYFPLIVLVIQIVIGIWNVKSLLLSVITFVCICELDFFVSAFLRLIPEGAAYITRDNISASVVSLVLILGIAWLCKFNDISFYKKNMRHRKQFVVIEVFVLFVNLGIMGTFFGMLSESSTGSYANVMLIMTMILSMLLSVITLIFYTAVMNAREYRLIHTINQRQLDRQKIHYEQLRERDRETRKFRHDIRNHFFVLSGLMKENKLEQAVKYLEEMTGQFAEVQKMIHTGNDIIDAILNENYRECLKKGISMTVEGVIYAALVISDYDICTILVNAMDNAVEACERITGSEKWIQVSIGMYQEYLHLIVKNSSLEGVNLKTKKRDKRNHGFGFENLWESVEKNQGRVGVKAENGIFELDVVVKAFEEEKA